MPAALTLDTTARDDDATVAVRSPAGLLAHLVEAVRTWHRQIDEDAVGNFIAQNGGRLTDDLERQISRRFGSLV